MNQENNNMNQEQFNTQGNNGVPNNQPLNSNNMYEQPMSNLQQSIPIQPPMSSLENNTYNLNNNKSSKKRNFGLIVGIIFAVLFVVVVIIFGKKLFFNKNINDNNGTNNVIKDQNNSNNIIKDIKVDFEKVVALTNNNDLYVIGKESYDELALGENLNYTEKPLKVASNVKSFFFKGSALYYIDNNNNLYRTGLKTSGGTSKTFEKIYSDVKTISSYGGLCIMITDLNNDLYGIKSKFADNACGLNSVTDDFTIMANKAKYSISGNSFSGYVSENNELFMLSQNMNNYEKILDNVDKVTSGGELILSGTKSLYKYNEYATNGEFLIKISDSVSDIYENEMSFKKDGKIYFNASKGTVADNSLVVFNDFNEYAYLNVDDIQKVVYASNGNGRYIYMDNKNNLVLFDSTGANNIGNNINALEKILKFIGNN